EALGEVGSELAEYRAPHRRIDRGAYHRGPELRPRPVEPRPVLGGEMELIARALAVLARIEPRVEGREDAFHVDVAERVAIERGRRRLGDEVIAQRRCARVDGLACVLDDGHVVL